MQELVELQEIPSRLLSTDGEGTGAVWIDQLVPFQRSTKGALLARPTVVQDVEEAQETLSIAISLPPVGGLGADCRDQEVPFQRSTRGL